MADGWWVEAVPPRSPTSPVARSTVEACPSMQGLSALFATTDGVAPASRTTSRHEKWACGWPATARTPAGAEAPRAIARHATQRLDRLLIQEEHVTVHETHASVLRP